MKGLAVLYFIISALASFAAVFATHRNDLIMGAIFLFFAIQASILASLFLVEKWRK
jgi:hypothetical protein